MKDTSLRNDLDNLIENFYNYIYYDTACISLNFDELNNDTAKSFISNYFGLGQKGSVVGNIGEAWDNNSPRPVHTVLLYLLFLLLYKDKRIGQKICNKIKGFKTVENDNNFHLRFFFLLCLYHDYGYYIEEKRKEIPAFNASYCEFDILNSIKGTYFKTPYTKENIKKYFYYRRLSEHGISGGTLLSKRLKDNFKKAAEIANAQGANEFQYPDNIQWNKKKDFSFYDFISSIIIKHNIWYAYKCEDKAKYSQMELNDFIIKEDGNNKLNFKYDPILFLFCLLDSIEPSKKLNVCCEGRPGELGIKALLENFYFDVSLDPSQNKYEIIIKLNDSIHAPGYIYSIKSLEEWMDLKVDVNLEESKATISFYYKQNYEKIS